MASVRGTVRFSWSRPASQATRGRMGPPDVSFLFSGAAAGARCHSCNSCGEISAKGLNLGKQGGHMIAQMHYRTRDKRHAASASHDNNLKFSFRAVDQQNRKGKHPDSAATWQTHIVGLTPERSQCGRDNAREHAPSTTARIRSSPKDEENFSRPSDSGSGADEEFSALESRRSVPGGEQRFGQPGRVLPLNGCIGTGGKRFFCPK